MPVEVEIVNFEKATDLRKLDFGPLRDPMEPYNPDSFNLGPRLGFAWTLGKNVSAYDALSLAAAQSYDATVLTADGPLARAPVSGVVVQNIRTG